MHSPVGCVGTLAGVTGYASLNLAVAQTADRNLSIGQVTVRLNGRVNWYAGIEASFLDSNSPTGKKTSTTNFFGDLRLYPGCGGEVADGLHDDATAEIRTNSGSSSSGESLYVFQAYGYLGSPEFGQARLSCLITAFSSRPIAEMADENPRLTRSDNVTPMEILS